MLNVCFNMFSQRCIVQCSSRINLNQLQISFHRLETVWVFIHTMTSGLAYTSSLTHYADGQLVSETLKYTSHGGGLLGQFSTERKRRVPTFSKKENKGRSMVLKTSIHHEF